MESIRNRAVEQFPTVLITLLSIVQALALEFLWDHLHHRPDLYEMSVLAVMGWLQIAASLIGMILIWLTYAGMVMRFRWTQSTMDSVLPFFVGLIQFLMIDLMGPDKIGPWLIVLGLVFATMVIGSHQVLRRARIDVANREFFDQVNPAKPRDFAAHTFLISLLVLLGVWLWISDVAIWIEVSVIAAALALLLLEFRNAATFWNSSMGIE